MPFSDTQLVGGAGPVTTQHGSEMTDEAWSMILGITIRQPIFKDHYLFNVYSSLPRQILLFSPLFRFRSFLEEWSNLPKSTQLLGGGMGNQTDYTGCLATMGQEAAPCRLKHAWIDLAGPVGQESKAGVSRGRRHNMWGPSAWGSPSCGRLRIWPGFLCL